MTLTQQRAAASLTARAARTKTNVTGTAVIGEQIGIDFDDADIAYSFKVTSTGAGDVATLTLSSGAVAQTTGTPTISDAGTDFEGVTLSTLVTLYAILFKRTTAAGAVAVASSSGDLPDITDLAGGAAGQVLVTYPSGITSPGTVALTMAATAESVEMVVIGKSS